MDPQPAPVGDLFPPEDLWVAIGNPRRLRNALHGMCLSGRQGPKPMGERAWRRWRAASAAHPSLPP